MKRAFNKVIRSFHYTVNCGIIPIESNYSGIQNYVSSYLIKGDIQGAVFVDPSANTSVPFLFSELENQGIKYVFITHVHLDHGCSTGMLLKECENAKVVAHPKCKRFLIDPAPLIKGSKSVYGEERFNFLYGDVIPVDEERIICVEDGDVVSFHGRDFQFLHTLGHATHHTVIFDEQSNGVFTGDNFGMNYHPENQNYILPSTTPIDFDPKKMEESVDIVMDTGASRAYLTHVGVWEDMEYGCELNHLGIQKTHDDVVLELIKKRGKYTNEEMVFYSIELVEDLLTNLVGITKEEIRNDVRFWNDVLLNAMGCRVYVERSMKNK